MTSPATAFRIGFALAALALLIACGGGGGDEHAAGVEPLDLENEPQRLARDLLIVDTHIDVPYRLAERPADVSEATAEGDFDWPRARAGGLDVVFMSVYVPARLQTEGGARALADRLIDDMVALSERRPERFVMVRHPDEAREAHASGRVGLALGIENGAALEGDLANLAHFHGRGVRYVTLTHSDDNDICDSSYDDRRTWKGLSPFGRKLVREMNRQGVMIDVSHVSDDAFREVMALSRTPVLASHSSCRHFTPGFERNMSDEMIRELAAGGGVVQINFGSSFIDDRYRRASQAARAEILARIEAEGVTRDSERGREIARRYREEHPIPKAHLSDVADHIDHVVKLVGIDHVGLGSDFDGVGDSLPVGLEDVSKYPALIAELLRRGYSSADIEKICSGNVLRVWSAVERAAEAS